MSAAVSVAPSGGAAPAVSQGHSSSPQGRQPTSGGGDFDYKSAFTSQGKKIQETERTIGDLRRELDSGKSDREMLRRLQTALNPNQESTNKPHDPIPQWESMLDYYIEQAVEAKNRGSGIPLTANLAIDHFKSAIMFQQTITEMKGVIGQLQQQVRNLSDPGHAINQRAFATFDTAIQNGLEQIYGNNPNSMPQRAALFKAVGDLMGPAVNSLMKNDPKKWDMIRRDPGELNKLASRALRAVLPPKAVQMIEEENLRNTPMSMSELRDAFNEAGKIKDEKERQRIRTSIRQDILAMSMGGKTER